MENQNSPNIFNRLVLFLSKIVPLDALGPVVGVTNLVLRRSVLRKLNLYRAPLEKITAAKESIPDHRTPDGSGNDPKNFQTGASNTAFGRNIPPAKSFDPEDGPSPQIIAAKLLERKRFRPAGDQINVLAAAWIQAMAHDWFGHLDSEETVELNEGTSGCPLQSFRFRRTKRRDDGAFDNFRTHWWDASFVYGQDAEAVRRARTFKGGKLRQSQMPGVLPKDEDDLPRVGDSRNSWVGVALLQDIFLREHNAVADAIVDAHPELASNDEKVFNYARLVVSAIVAKVHTVDWTVELLKTDTLRVGM